MRALAVLAVLAAGVAFPVAASSATPPVCKVPKLVGRTTAAARAALKRAGCPGSALTTATRCAAQSKSGLVLDQKPAAKAALKKGQKIAAHVGAYCPPPPPPPPPPAPPDFLGSFSGTYSGSLPGGAGCPDIAIGGLALVAVTQIGTSFDVDFYLTNAHVITTDMCMEVSRSDSEGELIATSSGATLGASGFTATLTGNTLTGSFQNPGGQFAFTGTRAG